MIYNIQNAGMTLGTARIVIAHLHEGWPADTVARAKGVIAHWERIRRNQAKKVKK